MFCRKCGEKIEENAKFCRFCGSKVEIVNESEFVQEDMKNPVQVMENKILEKDVVEEVQRHEKGQSKSKNILVGIFAVVAIVVLFVFLILNFQNNSKDEVSETINAESITEETLALIETTYAESYTEETSETNSAKITVTQKENEPTENTEIETIPSQETTPVVEEYSQQEKIVIHDSDEIYVEYWGIQKWSDESWVINLYVENNRSEEIDFILDNFRINDFTMDVGNNGAIIPAESKFLSGPDFNCVISVDELGQYGITTITEIDFDLSFENEATDEEISISEVHLEISEPIDGDFPVTELSKGDTILNQNDIYIGYRGLDETTYDDRCMIDFYIENGSEETAFIAFENARINGFVMDIGNSHIEIPAGSKHLTVPNYDLVVFFDTLSEYGITSVDTLKFDLIIEDCIRRRGTTAGPLTSDTLTAENRHPCRGSYS